MPAISPDPSLDPRTVYLTDYQPFSHVLDSVHLTFRLDPHQTRVTARLSLAANPARPGLHDLRLDGENLVLISAKIAGEPVACHLDDEGLTIAAADLPAGPFVLETEVDISPQTNTALEGLYMSNGMYCTQCEPQGFRKITYYPDRPDVMARFSVRIEGDLPVLLSNGNPLGQGSGWAEWDDPWPKPAYLFALVAGNLVAHPDRFTTRSGRDVGLNIWVRPGDESRCAWGMEALKKSMLWDEDIYGREYDLDIFNIVAVDDFNMGAMENKGLNIFNSKAVLASPDTATDDDFARVEAIIAHEYFHNWTGNRITCRDWFQLCLKEGLTVFRDQQFSGDMRGHAVKRIEDVLALRARQFREDSGPLAHAVRPASFVEINNFYTATVYEKGAEVIGMLKRLVGDADYARALDLYFARHDGHAATIEDWLQVFEDTTGRDLSQFKRWYTEAGTPRIKVYEAWAAGAKGGTYTLTLAQVNPPTPGQPEKLPKVIPVAVGLLNPNGDEVVPTRVLELTQAVQSFAFEGLASRPIASILRGFSAPVVLERDTPASERAFLLAHDTDPFNRWEAGRALAKEVLARMITQDASPLPSLLDGMLALAQDESLDPAFRALALRLPGEDDMAATLAASGHVPDPARIRDTRARLGLAIAHRLGPVLEHLETTMRVEGPFDADAKAVSKRALRLTALLYLAKLDGGQAARAAFAAATTMTESFGALAILLEQGTGTEELSEFETTWRTDRLVMDKWFAVQTAMAAPDDLAGVVNRLTARADFDMKNPNRFRAVIGSLSGNHAGFHHQSGAGYRLLADWLLRLDPINPQTAARMSSAFETWPRYDADRQGRIKSELARLAGTPGLSRDLSEMVGRMQGA
jgi:aminopeptidase N